jgi:hypothetical protein
MRGTRGHIETSPVLHPEPGEALHLDSLDLRKAVLGERVVLSEPCAGTLVLHEVAAGRARLLGAFDDAASAWLAIDALDASR